MSERPRPPVRAVEARDRAAIAEMLAGDTFVKDEVDVAMELVDAAIEGSTDYLVRVAVDGPGDDRPIGYVCFGPTPMTEGTYDMYWLCTHAAQRGRGVAAALIAVMERETSQAHGRLIRVETSQQESYGAARGFYERYAFLEVGRIPDFYKPGDDLLILCKKLAPAAR